MKTDRGRTLAAFVAAAAVSSAALAQGRGMGRGRGGFNWQGAFGGAGAAPGAMVEHAKKLYVVSGATLARLDLKEFEVEARADLTKLGRDEEQEKKERAAWIAQFDQNGDGAVDEAGDGDRWRWVRWMDQNRDGKVTADEAMMGPAPGAAGPVVLQVVGGKIVMLRGDMVFRFDPRTLELEASARIPQPEPEPEENAGAKDEGEGNKKEDATKKTGDGGKDVF